MSRKALSLALAILMVVSLLPMGAVATDAIASEVTYNLESYEVTVGYDTEQEEMTPWVYKLFDENGNYCITLENDAFFPYEVQFKVDGETFVEWFETPESTVEIAGHIFTVYSEANDDTKLTQIGVWVDGQYVAALPEDKVFSNPIIAPMSMIPLTVKNVSLDLSSYTKEQLAAVELSAVYSDLSSSNPTSEKAAWVKKMWASEAVDDFKVASPADTLDLTLPANANNNDVFYLEMIVGTATQLDTSNLRYIVTVTTDTRLITDISVYTQDGLRTKVTPTNLNTYRQTSNGNAYTLYQVAAPAAFGNAAAYYCAFELNSNYSAYTPTVYLGRFNTAEEAESAAAQNTSINVTSSILGQTMTSNGAGYYAENRWGYISQYFTIVLKNGADVIIEPINFYFNTNNVGFLSYYNLYSQATDGTRSSANSTINSSSSNGVQTRTFTLYSIYPTNAEYYYGVEYYTYGGGATTTADNTKVDKAVLGHYDSLSAASGQADIKSQLLTTNISTVHAGYKANYSGDGVKFTVFAEGEVYQFTVKVVAGTEDPISTSRDTYFHVSGATSLDTYAMPYTADTYYEKGYQTILINDTTADMSAITPSFWVRNPPQAYAPLTPGVGATLQESNVTTVDFSEGTVQYTAKAEDESVIKNYFVTFIKKETGAKLFVNGPVHDSASLPSSEEDQIPREIFLLDAYENVHDIFIANVGDAALTCLTATLSGDAENVKLDEYWTVDSDTLAAFTTTSTASYSQLANVAKVRLLPADTITGNGEISGTLTISSTNGGSYTIYLTGLAGNPEIVTDTIPDAVKYVPHSVMIQTNNHHSTVSQTFSIQSGSLPAGITLLPNGELYGVPTVFGTFTFTVKVGFSSSDATLASVFTDLTKTFTLTVLDNTDANVDAASDHTIDIRVPASMASYTDQVFEIDHVYADFMDFYLDGQKLTEGVHYDSEEGSTKITIRSQTFQNAGNGTHTIAAEFRENASTDENMTKAAQNYTSTATSNNSGSSGSSSTPKTPVNESTVIVIKPKNGTVTVSTMNPQKDDKVTVTVTPQYGYELDELKITNKDGKELSYTDNGDGTFTFISESSEVEVSATFSLIPTDLPFADVFAPDWYLDAIKHVYESGTMIGISETEFAPMMPTSRTMMVTVLYRIAGAPECGPCLFADIPEGMWYTDSVSWAAENGIVGGIGNNRFAPEQEMTREQMAVMLYNFCLYLNIELPENNAQEVTDAESISSWAIEAVTAMYKAGILSGKGEGVFDPQGAATRVEIAAMLQKFDGILGSLSTQDENDEEGNSLNR